MINSNLLRCFKGQAVLLLIYCQPPFASNMHRPTQVDIQMQHCKTDAITLGWCSALQHSQTYEKKTGDGHPNPSLV